MGFGTAGIQENELLRRKCDVPSSWLITNNDNNNSHVTAIIMYYWHLFFYTFNHIPTDAYPPNYKYVVILYSISIHESFYSIFLFISKFHGLSVRFIFGFEASSVHTRHWNLTWLTFTNWKHFPFQPSINNSVFNAVRWLDISVETERYYYTHVCTWFVNWCYKASTNPLFSCR